MIPDLNYTCINFSRQYPNKIMIIIISKDRRQNHETMVFLPKVKCIEAKCIVINKSKSIITQQISRPSYFGKSLSLWNSLFSIHIIPFCSVWTREWGATRERRQRQCEERALHSDQKYGLAMKGSLLSWCQNIIFAVWSR